MNCKSCNTRIPGGASNCPNCGLLCGSKRSQGAEDGNSGAPLTLSNVQEEIDLEEIATPVAPTRRKGKSASASTSKAKRSSASDSASGFAAAPAPSELRAMLSDQLNLLEPGLAVFKQQGKLVGEDFETDMGVIDLLACDDGGGLVVIMLSEADDKDVVTEMLGRIGWVRKHVCKTGQEVRGIVIAQTLPEGVEYAAAAVADTISFKSCRMSLSFSDISF